MPDNWQYVGHRHSKKGCLIIDLVTPDGTACSVEWHYYDAISMTAVAVDGTPRDCSPTVVAVALCIMITHDLQPLYGYGSGRMN